MSEKKLKSQNFRHWGLVLLSVSVIAPMLSIGGMLYFYLKTEVESRRTIAFMNFEQQAYRIKEMLRDEARLSLDRIDGQTNLRFGREPRALLIKSDQKWQAVFGQLNASETSILQNLINTNQDLQVFRDQGQLLITALVNLDQNADFATSTLKPGAYLAVWNLDANFLPQNLPSDTHHLYLINQQSNLIYSSLLEETAETILKKPLVQEFIRSPLSRAGTPLRTTNSGQSYGFYMAVPDSNLTLFVENSASFFFNQLIAPTSIALGILLALGGVTILVWRSTVSSLTEQVQRLSHSLDEFAKGYLIPTQLSSESFLAELHPLVESINKNTRGVRNRVDLMEKQQK